MRHISQHSSNNVEVPLPFFEDMISELHKNKELLHNKMTHFMAVAEGFVVN
jgi:hypothetical protein